MIETSPTIGADAAFSDAIPATETTLTSPEEETASPPTPEDVPSGIDPGAEPASSDVDVPVTEETLAPAPTGESAADASPELADPAAEPIDASPDQETEPEEASDPAILEAYGQTPLAFEANQGQTDDTVAFLSRGIGYTLFLTPTETVLSLQNGTEQDAGTSAVVRVQLVDGNATPEIVGLDLLPGTTNYLTGSDPDQWVTDVATYAKVAYQEIYAGIDQVYYGNQQQLEYDFVVSPGADPTNIRLAYQGTEALTLDEAGNLLLHTPGGVVVQQAPVLYQEIDGLRQAVAGEFVLHGDNQAGFQVGAYDTTRTLVIDPVLIYSTYLGGTGPDDARDIAVDANGYAYIVGTAGSADFPTHNALDSSLGGPSDIFVTKLSRFGNNVVYSTYLGGSSVEQGRGIAVDGSGNVYVVGQTDSSDFPTLNAFQSKSGGDTDMALAVLSATGSSLLYATYLGGGAFDSAEELALGAAGTVLVAGMTQSADFPTKNPLDASLGGSLDAVVARLDTTQVGAASLEYATYLGGSADDSATGIAIDAAGNAYVMGQTASADFAVSAAPFGATLNGTSDAFVSILNAAGSALTYSSFLGGSGDEEGGGIAVDGAGLVYLAGRTTSADLPTTAGTFDSTLNGTSDAFVFKLDPSIAGDGGQVFASYLGGDGDEQHIDLAIDGAGTVYVSGASSSGTNFPLVGQIQSFGGARDAFVSQFNATATGLLFSTFLGGAGTDTGYAVAVDALGNIYVAGETTGSYPTTSGAFQTSFGGASDGFVTKISVNGKAFGVLNINDSGAGSLRQAILDANSNAGQDVIFFNIAGAGPHTILVGPTDLPILSEAVIINGTTNPDFAGAPTVEVDGGGTRKLFQIGSAADGTTIQGLSIVRALNTAVELLTGADNNRIVGNYIGLRADGSTVAASPYGVRVTGTDVKNNTIGGTTAAERNVISGHTVAGISIEFPSDTGTVIQGNYIGTDATGNVAKGNVDAIILSANFTTIGGSVAGAGNVIAGSTDASNANIIIQSGDNNVIQGNIIGLAADGTALANAGAGIDLRVGSDNNIIGGTTTLARNVISSHTGNGLRILSGSTGNLIQDNYFGTDATGLVNKGNNGSNIVISDSPSNTIGGSAAGAGNVLAASKAGSGVLIFGASSTGNRVQGNLIGTDATGVAGLGNASIGVDIQSGSNTIGGSAAGEGNVIAGNNNIGLRISSANNVVVRGNYIGVSKTGTGALANNGGGIFITGSASDNTIGGSAVGDANRIAFNTGDGVAVSGFSVTGNTILGNSIHSNTGLGIDLGPDGVTANDAAPDADTGANNLQNFPVLATTSFDGTNTTVNGTLTSAGSSTYRVELFGNSEKDASGNGEGQTFLAFQNVTTDAAGIKAFSIVIPGAVGPYITATATELAGGTTPTNTSEFSNAIQLGLVVNTTTDNGNDLAPTPGSLRQAIVTANGLGGKDVIFFSIGTGAKTIAVPAVLPTVTEAVIIDATSQPGYAGTPLIFLDGAGAGVGADGLTITAGNSTVRGLVIGKFGGSGLVLQAGGNNQVQGNWIGTDAAGTGKASNNLHGLVIMSPSNTVGGTTAAERNVFSGNLGDGILITGMTASLNLVRGNYLGTDAAGMADLGNGSMGIEIAGGNLNIIGGTALGAGNVISGNDDRGIWIHDATAVNNQVLGNLIGTDHLGTGKVGNTFYGVKVENANTNTIGGTAAGAGNRIAFNDIGVGIFTGGTGNAILGNSISNNTSLGIDLNSDGVTPNDAGDPDAGPNDLQNFPVLTSAVTSGANTTIHGTLDSIGGKTYRIEFFASTAGDPSGNGEGDVYLGFVNTAANTPFTFVGPAGPFITATATELTSGNTSEFSQVLTNSVAFVVTSSASSGSFTLREAIIAANGNAGKDLILIQIGSGPVTINLTTALPSVTDPVTIDGTAQPGFNGQPIVELDGSGIAGVADGLTITAGNSLVKGLVINSFNGSGLVLQTNGGNVVQGNWIGLDLDGNTARPNQLDGIYIPTANNTVGGTTAAERNVVSANIRNGIYIDTINGNNNVIRGNYLGTDVTGLLDRGNGQYGQHIQDGTANTIGGTANGAGNVISGNDKDGLRIEDGSTNNLVQGNRIGTNAPGTGGLHNTSNGVTISQANSNTLGGAAPGAGNLISGNLQYGVEVAGPAQNNQIQGNKIGTQVDATTALGNGQAGVIVIGNASQTSIGGAGKGEGNVIAWNATHGVMVVSGDDNNIRGNSMFHNQGGEAIEIFAGANADAVVPILNTAATPDGTALIVTGTVAAPAGALVPVDIHIDLFANLPGSDDAGQYEGQIYLGSQTILQVQPGTTNTFSFTLDVPDLPSDALNITATATDDTGGLSTPVVLARGAAAPGGGGGVVLPPPVVTPPAAPPTTTPPPAIPPPTAPPTTTPPTSTTPDSPTTSGPAPGTGGGPILDVPLPQLLPGELDVVIAAAPAATGLPPRNGIAVFSFVSSEISASDGELTEETTTRRQVEVIDLGDDDAYLALEGNTLVSDRSIARAMAGYSPFTTDGKKAAEIRGRVFEDADGSGEDDKAKQPLIGQAVYLDLNRNGFFDDGEPAVYTNENGEYKFERLVPGAYEVRQLLRPTILQTYPRGNEGHKVHLASVKDVAEANFGYLPRRRRPASSLRTGQLPPRTEDGVPLQGPAVQAVLVETVDRVFSRFIVRLTAESGVPTEIEAVDGLFHDSPTERMPQPLDQILVGEERLFIPPRLQDRDSEAGTCIWLLAAASLTWHGMMTEDGHADRQRQRPGW